MDFNAVIVGSGYGAAIAAAHLAIQRHKHLECRFDGEPTLNTINKPISIVL